MPKGREGTFPQGPHAVAVATAAGSPEHGAFYFHPRDVSTPGPHRGAIDQVKGTAAVVEILGAIDRVKATAVSSHGRGHQLDPGASTPVIVEASTVATGTDPETSTIVATGNRTKPDRAANGKR